MANYAHKISAEGLVILGKNIDGLNNPTNRDKLVKTFELYGIQLSDKDKKMINKRNDYLHGRNPLDLQYTFELTQISLRLHTLIVALLLKSVGYSGHIINLDIHSFITNEEKMLELVTEHHSFYTKLVNEIQQAVEDHNKEKLTHLKTEFGEQIENTKLADVIRII